MSAISLSASLERVRKLAGASPKPMMRQAIHIPNRGQPGFLHFFPAYPEPANARKYLFCSNHQLGCYLSPEASPDKMKAETGIIFPLDYFRKGQDFPDGLLKLSDGRQARLQQLPEYLPAWYGTPLPLKPAPLPLPDFLSFQCQ